MTKLNSRTLTLLLGLCLLLVAGLATAWLLQGGREARRWVSHTTQVREALADYRVTALRTELAVRGYLLTGSQDDLQAYSASSSQVGGKLAVVRRLAADNPPQQRRLAELQAFVSDRQANLRTAIALRREGRTSEAIGRLDDASSRARAIRMVELIGVILSEEIRLDQSRQQRASRLEDATIGILSVSALILLIVILVAMHDRRQRLRDLESANAQLATDVARRQAVERELALLAENATDAVFRVGLDGRFLYASPSVLDVIGVPPDMLIGQSLFTHLHPDDEVAVFTALHRLRSGEVERVTVTYRVSLTREPGKWLWLEASSGTIRDDNGQPLEIIASLRNVTLRKQLEQDLREARSAAEAAASAKSNFLANMSHEIRTPMNGVVGFADLLLGTDLSRDQRNYVQLIADSGAAMTRLLNDILDFSKVEAGQMPIAREPFDLHQTLDACAKLIMPALLKKDLKLECEIDPALPGMVRGDALRLRQVLLNLLGNAAKFTERGAVTLHAWSTDDVDGPQLVIEVEDSGIGIPAERQAAIFDPFVQAEDGTAARFGGTGLGLPISAQLARLMGGRLDLASEPGCGTRVRLTIPLDAVEAIDPAAPPEAMPAESGSLIEQSDLRVLVVEDHDVNQILITAMLKQLGCEVDIAADGAQAVVMATMGATAGPYAVVLMDLQLPVMDGLEATRRIRAAGLTPDSLPIIALTANAYADDVAACIAAGMQAHIAKPLRLADLQSALAAWAGRSAEAPVVETAPESGVRGRYAVRKRETLAKLEEAAGLPGLDEAVLDELAELLHKLAGTAGMFGDAELGDRARDLEGRLRTVGRDERLAALAQALPGMRRAA